MNFLAPTSFFLGLLLPVIVTFYLLKLRRVEQSVPSVYLWRRMVRDVEANAPWQKLRFNLLMLLQLLFLAALILALTRPFTWAEGSSGQAAIFILDSSASMSATDQAPSRLGAAKQEARRFADELPDTARVTVIDAGQEAQVRVSSSLDRREIHNAIDGIQAGLGGSDMTTAIQLASAIAARQPGTDIFVFSDGGVTLPDRLGVKGNLRYYPMGLLPRSASASQPGSDSAPSGDNNQAVSLLTLEQAPGDTLTAFAQVSNYASRAASRRLSLYADGRLVNVFDLNDIPPGGQKAVVAEGLPPEIKTIQAQLDGSDLLALDDRAVAVRPQSQTARVTLVGGNNLFIKAALAVSNVTMTQVESGPNAAPTPAAGITPTPAPSPTPLAEAATAPADLTIYDGTVPDALPAQGSLLFVAPPRSTDLFTLTGMVDHPELRALDPSDPLLANVSLGGVSVLDAARIELPNWAVPVVGGDLKDKQGNPLPDEVPLIFRGETGGRRVVVIAFDLHHSDLPLNLAFPLMWANLMDWLLPGARSPLPAQVAPGDSLAFTAPAAISSSASSARPAATITRPDGSQEKLQAENGQFIFADTGRLGIYTVDFGGGKTASFAVNLFSARESDVKRADALPGLINQAGAGGAASQLGQREWWRYLALLALGLIMGEWLVYQRAGLSRLRDLLLGFARRGAPSAARQAARRAPVKGRK